MSYVENQIKVNLFFVPQIHLSLILMPFIPEVVHMDHDMTMSASG